MVARVGFEPTNGRTKTCCLTTWRPGNDRARFSHENQKSQRFFAFVLPRGTIASEVCSAKVKKKTVLITGASRGIGRATAEIFTKNGFQVLGHGREHCADKIFTKFFVANFLEFSEIESMFAKIEKEFGTLDVLINNAGTVNRKKIDEFSGQDFQDLFAVNVTAPFLCARAAWRLGASAIVNVGSMRGFSQEATTPDYSASKAAVHNLTVSLARAFAPQCRVNCVAPGFTRTPFHDTNPERLKLEAAKTPLEKCAKAKEIAESIFFLASEKSSFTTGATLLVDGGRNFV